ncbi:hypothetical protein GF376_02565, partial [Candidatus Peregrinibacteria bacterium]|nr:hypothetical protein [Candidatus Peregrinibacteria bacterium]
ANAFSEEVLTIHYHHLHAESSGQGYQTSRLVEAGQTVSQGEVIGKEGGTPHWPRHLHFGIRRWKNLHELKRVLKSSNYAELFGYGYSYGNHQLIQANLSPETVLFGGFMDDADADLDSQKAAHFLQKVGIEFGYFNGNFGYDDKISRAEAARWIKVASEISSLYSKHQTFSDISKSSEYFPYLEALAHQRNYSIIDPENKNFHPDQPINRAELSKLIVLGLHYSDFFKFYDNWFWKGNGVISELLQKTFLDTQIDTWYASYAIYAQQKGLFRSENQLFNPSEEITRAEAAHWIEKSFDPARTPSHFCAKTVCGPTQYCHWWIEDCFEIPRCLPSDKKLCPVGGGLTNEECQCQSGECCDGCQFLSASTECDRSIAFRCTGSNPGEDAQLRTEKRFCSGNSSSCDGDYQNSNWEIFTDCRSDEICGFAGAVPYCYPHSGGKGSISSSTCEERFQISGDGCFKNPDSAGQPTICLEIQGKGPDFDYRVCKENGVFQNAITYQILDDNNLSFGLGPFFSEKGKSCTTWRLIDLSYLENGLENSAGLKAFFYSPADCTQQGCSYHSGYKTITKTCQ